MPLIRYFTLATFTILAVSTGLIAFQHGGRPAKVTTPRVEESAVETGPSIDFIALGDSGYETRWFSFFGSWYGIRGTHWAPGESGLPVMGPILTNYCKSTNCDFAVMLGDNIYPDGVDGLDAEDDQERFEDVFNTPFAPLLEHDPDFRIYPTLGNHDWRGKRKGAEAQLKFLKTTPPFDMRGLFYSVKPEGVGGLVEVFVIDTEMLLSTATVYEPKLADDGSEARDIAEIDDVGKHVGALSEAEKNQLKWLKEALAASTAEWKIVTGHHPLWSSGSTKFEQAHTLREMLLPILCGNADAYFAGHEHTLEVHADTCETVIPKAEASPLLSVVSGAFSKSRPLHPKFMDYQAKTYSQLETAFVTGKIADNTPHQFKQTWGFAHVSLLGDKATIRVISQIEDTDVPAKIKPIVTCVFTKGIGFTSSCAAPTE